MAWSKDDDPPLHMCWLVGWWGGRSKLTPSLHLHPHIKPLTRAATTGTWKLDIPSKRRHRRPPRPGRVAPPTPHCPPRCPCLSSSSRAVLRATEIRLLVVWRSRRQRRVEWLAPPPLAAPMRLALLLSPPTILSHRQNSRHSPALLTRTAAQNHELSPLEAAKVRARAAPDPRHTPDPPGRSSPANKSAQHVALQLKARGGCTVEEMAVNLKLYRKIGFDQLIFAR